jgi:glycosyltransferase involved in cell wall biosynthesis
VGPWASLRVDHVNDIASVGSVLAAAQARRGAVARVLDPRKPLAHLPYPWKVLSFPLRLLPILAAVMDLRRDRSALVHVHYATQGVVALAVGRPYVIHCHGSDIRGARPGSLRGRFLSAILWRAALVLYATPDLASDVGRFRQDAVFLPNPIDSAAFMPSGAATHDVLMATSLHPVKGARTAIEALAQLLERRPATTITVIASGPLLDLARSRLGDRARFIVPVDHARMPDLIRDHRVALGQFELGILSQLELESLACGVPVVTAFDYPEVYEDQPPIQIARDPAEIAGRLADLLDDDERRSASSHAGRAWVVANHDLDRVADLLYEAYAGAGLIAGRETGTSGAAGESQR